MFVFPVFPYCGFAEVNLPRKDIFQEGLCLKSWCGLLVVCLSDNILLTPRRYFQSYLSSSWWFFLLCFSTCLRMVSELAFFSASIFHLPHNNQDILQFLWKRSLSTFKCLSKTGLFQHKLCSFSVHSPVFQNPNRIVHFIHIIGKFILFIQNRAGKILGKVIQFIHYSRAGSAVQILDPGLSNLFLKTFTAGESITSLGNLFQHLTIFTTRK